MASGRAYLARASNGPNSERVSTTSAIVMPNKIAFPMGVLKIYSERHSKFSLACELKAKRWFTPPLP
jgi:hypothetical protein